MNQPELDQLVVRAITQILTNPYRYGLTWRLLPATVLYASSGQPVFVRVDGDPDDSSLPVISLIGSVRANTRVMIAVVPPSGAYIVGEQPTSLVYGSRYLATLTYTATTDITPDLLVGARLCRQRLWGAGGGGGGVAAAAASQAVVAGGGGGGGYSESWVDLSGFTTTTLTIGDGGDAGTTAGTTGTAGTQTAGLGGYVANGGNGGEGDTSSAGNEVTQGGEGGTATGNILALTGGDGGNGIKVAGIVTQAGWGGAHPLGSSRRVSAGNNGGGGIAGYSYGNGGSGAFAQATIGPFAGGDGSNGYAILELYG